jgi:outer membrane protein TolC
VANLTLKQILREGEENPYLPSLSLTGKATTSASIADSSISTSYSLGGISFTLSSSDKYTKDQLALSSTIGQNTYQKTLNTIESLVTNAYWKLASAQVVVKDDLITVESQKRYLQEIEEEYEGGLTTTLQVNQAKLALYDAQLALQLAQQQATLATDTLNLLMGTEGEWETEDLPAVTEVADLSTMLLRLGTTSSAKSLSYAVKQAELNLKSEENSSISPTVSFSASTSLSGDITTSDISLKDSTSLSVSVSVPLNAYLKNSSTQIDLDSKEYDVQIAQAEYDSGLQSLKAQVKTSYATLQQAKANLEKLGEHQKLAKEQLELVQLSYEAGQSTFNELQDSIAEEQSASLSVIKQKLTYTLALYNLSSLLEVETTALTITK